MEVAIGIWLLLEAFLMITFSLPKYAKKNSAIGVALALVASAWLIVAGVWIL